MDSLMVSMRLIHIISGVVWVGATYTMEFFIGPSVQATGDAGRQFMQYFGLRTKFGSTMVVVGILSVVSGLIMYWNLYQFRPEAMTTASVAVLTIGALFGIIALITGYIYQGRAIARMKILAGEIQAGDGPPSPEQMAEMGNLSKQLNTGGKISTILMTLALIGMASARYIG